MSNSNALSSKEIATAAAQGVAIALNARIKQGVAPAEVAEFIRNPLIFGIPPVLFEVVVKPDPVTGFSVHSIEQQRN